MKQLITLALLLACSLAFPQQKITDTINSAKLNEMREITIGIPASYNLNTSKKYPLLVLLDGDYLFDPFSGALQFGGYWDDIPEMLVVGISQAGTRDEDTRFDPQTGLPEGKGEKFFEFVGEVVTAMEKNYRVAPFKIVAGHDLSAAFLNYYLYKDVPLFSGYISMSPELPPGMEEQIPERLAKIQQPIFYYHSTADGDLKKMQKRILALDAEASKIKKPNLNYRFDDFKGASHYSLVLHSIPSALYQFFQAYQPIYANEFNEKIATLTGGYVDYLVAKYETLENVLGMKLNIRYSDFKAIEAAIMKNKAYTEFDKLSDLARKNYPKTMLPDYHMAMMYEKTGETKRAIKAYTNAFQKEEIGDLTKDMMLERADDLKGM